MKVFNIAKSYNTIIHGRRMPLNSVYGKFRLCNGSTMTYYIDDFEPFMGALWFHYYNEYTHKWCDTNTRASRVYVAFHCYLYDKFTKFNVWGKKCSIYVDKSLLPQEKKPQTDETMQYKTAYVGYALNKRIMTDDTVSYVPRACVTSSDRHTVSNFSTNNNSVYPGRPKNSAKYNSKNKPVIPTKPQD